MIEILGRHIRFGSFDRRLQDVAIVGVVGDATQGDLRDREPHVLYVAALQEANAPIYPVYVIASNGNSQALAPAVRRVLLDGGREYAQDVSPLAEVFDRAPSALRISATLAAAIGGLAVLLALIGIYGALAYAVARRTREIGVRVALGAAPGSVARLVLREGFVLTGIGIAIGLPLAFGRARAAGQALRSLIFGITPTDIVTFVAVSLSFLALALAAGVVPARRATRVDPVVALRAE